MASPLAYAGAGLLQGVGQGIAARGKAKREEKLREIEYQREQEMAQQDRQFRKGLLNQRQEFQRGQSEREWERERGQITSTFTDDQGRVIGVTPTGETKPLGKAQQQRRQPKIFEYYDEETGRKRKGVMGSDGTVVPVGGVAARDADGKNSRVISGDSPEGRTIGLKPGERAEVSFENGRATDINMLDGQEPSQRETKIQQTMDTYDVDRKTAQGLMDRILDTETDPMTGNTYIVNKIDGTAQRLNYDDGKTSRENTGGQSSGALTPRSQRQSQAGNQSGGQSAATSAERGGEANAQAARLAQEEGTTLWNSVEGVPGVSGFVTEAYSRLGGQVGLGEGEETQETVSNRQFFRLAQNDLIRSLSLNPRFPVGEINRIQKETDIEPKMFDSEQSLRGRMEKLDSVLRNRLQQERQASNNRDLPVQTRQNAAAAAKDIGNFLEILGVPQDNGDGGASGSGGVDVGRIQQMSIRELDNLDANTMTRKQLEAASQRYDELAGPGVQ